MGKVIFDQISAKNVDQALLTVFGKVWALEFIIGVTTILGHVGFCGDELLVEWKKVKQTADDSVGTKS